MENPLRDPQDRRLPRIPGPCALVIFGVTGDLARKKLIPAIYDLANRGLLPSGFLVLGFARRDWGDGDFEQLARASAQEHARTPWRDEVWGRLSGSIKFVSGSFDDDAAFDRLATTLDELRDSHGTLGNAAFYLSIPPTAFPDVLKQLARTGMADNERSGGWRRVVVEKPFGTDLESARKLNDLVERIPLEAAISRLSGTMGVDFSGVSTNPEMSFEECLLRYASFTRLSLRKTRFLRCQAREVNLFDCDLTDAEFTGSRASKVNTPVEWLVGVIRTLRVPLDNPKQVKLADATFWALGQHPFYPPSVGGWPNGAVWLSTASAIGLFNCPGPRPCPPQVPSGFPSSVNFWTRLLPYSLTYRQSSGPIQTSYGNPISPGFVPRDPQ